MYFSFPSRFQEFLGHCPPRSDLVGNATICKVEICVVTQEPLDKHNHTEALIWEAQRYLKDIELDLPNTVCSKSSPVR